MTAGPPKEPPDAIALIPRTLRSSPHRPNASVLALRLVCSAWREALDRDGGRCLVRLLWTPARPTLWLSHFPGLRYLDLGFAEEPLVRSAPRDARGAGPSGGGGGGVNEGARTRAGPAWQGAAGAAGLPGPRAVATGGGGGGGR
jgi:hypothetical protein